MSEEKKKNSQSQEEIVVNLDSFAVPGAIIIAGIIIAASIFFTNKGNTKADVSGTTDTSNEQNGDEPEFTDASTSIDDDYFVGNKDSAKVAIVEFSDYQCPYCQRHAQDTYPDLVKEYVDTGKVIYVFRDFPLDFHGQIAVDTAEASECVAEIAPNKFVEFHDKAFLVADRAALDKVASDLGVDKGRYDTCMSERRYKAEVEKDLKDGGDSGVTGTPGFIVGLLNDDGTVSGKMIAGAYPFESFATIIDELLAK